MYFSCKSYFLLWLPLKKISKQMLFCLKFKKKKIKNYLTEKLVNGKNTILHNLDQFNHIQNRVFYSKENEVISNKKLHKNKKLQFFYFSNTFTYFTFYT